MSSNLILSAVLVVALAGVVHMQQTPQGSYGQGPLNGALGGALNFAQDLPGQLTNQLGLTPSQNQQQQQQQGGLLSGLLGGGSGSNGSGPLETLRQLPARGLQLLNNVLTGVRGMLPLGLGRNGNNQNQNNPLGQLSPDQLLQQLPKNPVTDLASGLLSNNNSGMNNMNNGLRLPNLNQITQPITGPLQQGRLPDLNEITSGAQSTVRDLTNGLGSTLSNTLNGSQGQAQGRGAQGGLGGLLSSLGTATA